MTPLEIRCHLRGPIVMRHPIQLDALLEYVMHDRAGVRLPPVAGGDHGNAEVPLAMSECGRYRLCSAARFRLEVTETDYKNRRAPWLEMARLGSSKIRRVDIATGANKGYHAPYSAHHVEGDQLVWWALGDAEGVRDMLSEVHYVGRFRGAGKGRVLSWDVQECAPWEGFPCWVDGEPTRPLPVDVAPESKARHGFAVLKPPYWDQVREEPCLLPAQF